MPDAPSLDLPLSPTEATQPFTTAAEFSTDDALDFSLDDPAPRTVPMQRAAADEKTVALPPRSTDDGLDFDLGDLSQPPAPKPAAAAAEVDFGDFGIGADASPPEPPPEAPADADPLARKKIELAEEFRQIGDMEGARDLLEEVIAKAEGSLKAKARGMLDRLG